MATVFPLPVIDYIEIRMVCLDLYQVFAEKEFRGQGSLV